MAVLAFAGNVAGQTFEERQQQQQQQQADTITIRQIQEKYEDLPVIGKCAATAAIGFLGAKAAMKTFIKMAKVVGAAFIATEVLSASGALDEMPAFVDDHVQTVATLKDRFIERVRTIRNKFREVLKKERLPALAFSLGAIFGVAL